MAKRWIHFIHPDGHAMLSITADEVFQGEIRNTAERPAYENHIEPKVTRTPAYKYGDHYFSY